MEPYELAEHAAWTAPCSMYNSYTEDTKILLVSNTRRYCVVSSYDETDETVKSEK